MKTPAVFFVLHTAIINIINKEVLVLIKITNYVRINILTILVFIVCYITKTLKILCVSYAVMLAHELAHTLAATCIGLKISHISFFPFGVNLKLKNKMVYSLADEVILYISGPLANVLFALAAVIIYNIYPSQSIKLFYISNIMLFVMNMLPALPLDGGIILKKILSYAAGEKTAMKVIRGISAVISLILLFVGFGVLYITKMNFSILVFAVLMAGNMFTQSEKYDVDFVKELMFYKKKVSNKIKHIIVSEKLDYRKIVKQLDKKFYHIIYLMNDEGEIQRVITETQLLNSLMDSNITIL